jgi:hypothetical protein
MARPLPGCVRWDEFGLAWTGSLASVRSLDYGWRGPLQELDIWPLMPALVWRVQDGCLGPTGLYRRPNTKVERPLAAVPGTISALPRRDQGTLDHRGPLVTTICNRRGNRAASLLRGVVPVIRPLLIGVVGGAYPDIGEQQPSRATTFGRLGPRRSSHGLRCLGRNGEALDSSPDITPRCGPRVKCA